VWSVSREKGSAVTDFVLVAFPMLAIFSATISITLGSYARVVLLDATIEGARFAALADQDIASGIAKTKKLVAASLGPAARVEVEGVSTRIGTIDSIRLVSTLGVNILPGSKLLSVSSVATREVEY
jgi:Flp pilus assembly protein TadG